MRRGNAWRMSATTAGTSSMSAISNSCAVRDVVARREARHLRGENEHAHDQRQADGLQQIELEAGVVRDLAALDADLFQHGVQLDRVETQMMHEAR